MNKVYFSVIAVVLAVFAFSSCKKDGSSETIADRIAGNYYVNDTTASLTGCDGGAPGDVSSNSYGIIITKKSDNVVTISSFNRCDDSFDASVSETSIVALQSEPCTTVGSVSGTISGDKIRFTYEYFGGICTFNCRATAVKQQ